MSPMSRMHFVINLIKLYPMKPTLATHGNNYIDSFHNKQEEGIIFLLTQIVSTAREFYNKERWGLMERAAVV